MITKLVIQRVLHFSHFQFFLKIHSHPCGRGHFDSDQGTTSTITRNLINFIGYLCEQDLELTPPILPGRANFCGRGHPKIDQFHTNILFWLSCFYNLYCFILLFKLYAYHKGL